VLLNLPNLISLARLLSVPVAIWLMTRGAFDWAFWLFVAAGASDAVDGFIAKRFHQKTELGRFLDPFADKALLIGVYVTLGVMGHLPSWLVILVVARDVLLVGCTAIGLLMGQVLRFEPLLISKANTLFQIVLAALMLASLGYGLADENLIDVLCGIVTATTVLSGIAYLYQWAVRTQSVENIR
jgi:cardiolipin synthase